LKVALDAARGLAFLHSAETKVIYRDFKTSNILLDSVCELLTFCIQYVETVWLSDLKQVCCLITELQCKTF